MNWEVRFLTSKFKDKEGIHKEECEKHIIPFKFRQIIWYVYKKERRFRKDKWVVRKSMITSIWATNIVGVRIDNNWTICDDDFNRLFLNENDAIDFCLEKMERGKIRVENRDSW